MDFKFSSFLFSVVHQLTKSKIALAITLAQLAAEEAGFFEAALSGANFVSENATAIFGGGGISAATVGGLTVGLNADRKRASQFLKTDVTPQKARISGPESISTKKARNSLPVTWGEALFGIEIQPSTLTPRPRKWLGGSRGRGARGRRKRRFGYRYRE